MVIFHSYFGISPGIVQNHGGTKVLKGGVSRLDPYLENPIKSVQITRIQWDARSDSCVFSVVVLSKENRGCFVEVNGLA